MNCQIRGDRANTLKFAEVAQIRELCESRYACEKFTVLTIIGLRFQSEASAPTTFT